MQTKSVVKNASWIVGARIAQAILSFLIGMFTARFLGPSNYGLINYAASIVAFVTPIMELGITNVIVHQLIENKKDEGLLLGSALLLNAISAVVCIILITVFAYLTNSGEKETVIVCILYSILLIFKAVEILNYWFQAHLISKYSSIASLIAYVIVSVYKIYLLITLKSVYWFALSYAIDNCIIAIILYIIYKKLNGQSLKFSKKHASTLLSQGKYYILSSMMVTIFAQTDKIMLKSMLGNESVGYYTASVTCAAITGFIFTAIIDSFRPLIFESKKQSVDKFENNIKLLYSIIIYCSLIQCLIMTIFAGFIVITIYGDQYNPAVDSLRIVVWYTTFAYLGSVRNIWLLSENKQRFLWKINLSGAIANIVLNLLLIPLWGINGAAVASLLTQFITNVILGFVFKPILKNNILMIKSLNPHLLINAIKNTLFNKSNNKG